MNCELLIVNDSQFTIILSPVILSKEVAMVS